MIYQTFINITATECHSPQDNPDYDASLYKVIPHPMKPYMLWRSCVATLYDKWRNSRLGLRELDRMHTNCLREREREREGGGGRWRGRALDAYTNIIKILKCVCYIHNDVLLLQLVNVCTVFKYIAVSFLCSFVA